MKDTTEPAKCFQLAHTTVRGAAASGLFPPNHYTVALTVCEETGERSVQKCDSLSAAGPLVRDAKPRS